MKGVNAQLRYYKVEVNYNKYNIVITDLLMPKSLSNLHQCCSR